MKKFATGFLVSAVLLCGITAFASEPSEQDIYFGSDKMVHVGEYNDVNGANFTTVLIRKSGTTGSNDVVYVDQQSDGFGSVMNFMLKDSVENDQYTATFGNSNGDTKSINFTTGSFEIKGKTDSVTLDRFYKMSVADEPISHNDENFEGRVENGYKKSFIFEAEAGKVFDKVYLVSADGVTCHGHIELKPISTNFTGDVNVLYGIQIYNILEQDKGINLYLVEKEADAQ